MKAVHLIAGIWLACCSPFGVWGEYVTIPSTLSPNYAIRAKDLTGQVCDSGSNNTVGWADLGSHHLFYWFHQARTQHLSKPLLLWLQGGPGNSGFFGNFLENGPCRLEGNPAEAVRHEHPWTELFNVIFVDQPVNVGFSYSDDSSGVNHAEAAAIELVDFIRVFYQGYPDMRDVPLFIAGESYGGRYVPMTAAAVIEFNKFQPRPEDAIPLKGIMVGNGYTSPKDVYSSGYELGCFPFKGFQNYFNSSECARFSTTLPECLDLLRACEALPGSAICRRSAEFCMGEFEFEKLRPQHSWDRRKYCDPPEKCIETSRAVTTWMNTPEIWELLEIESQTNKVRPVGVANSTVSEQFLQSGDIGESTVTALERILRYASEERTRGSGRDIDVLYYNGVTDILCSSVGTQRMLENLKWPGEGLYRASPWATLSWKTVEGVSAGQLKRADGLWYAELENAGHLVPTDQPIVILKLLSSWLGKSLFSERVSDNDEL
ncbi:hypothetical protein Neosp_005772 [[Neocosmospora] mangrovei]